MKIFVVLVFIFFNYSVEAKSNRLNDGHICQKKYVTVHGEYDITNQNIKITSHKSIEDLIILEAYGIDGLKVGDSTEVSLGNINAGESATYSLGMSFPENKRSFLILRINYQLEEKDIDELVTISVGELSQGQNSERGKNIKEINGAKLHLFQAK